ncbi:MAG: envelope stress response membrane protein PspB [Sphingosinicella sp.]|uniref:envelope stress response membrane protein PspB n=1 Tax=Sphingosinicella sp. TaxID=1917971 RepID=UPI004037BCA8
MDGAEILIPIIVVPVLFVILPWIIFHYITKWKTAATITTEDENLLDELHDLARRLDDRMCTIERIVQAENPNWRQLGCDPVETALEDRGERLMETARATRAPRRKA